MIKVVDPQKQNSSQEKDELTQEILHKLRHQDEEGEVSAQAEKLGLSYIDTNLFPISEDALRSIEKEEAEKFQVAPIQKIGRKTSLVSPSPTEEATRQFIQSLEKERGWEIKLFLVSHYNFGKILERYEKLVMPDIVDQLEINLGKEDIDSFDKELQDLINLKQRIKELPTTEVLNVLMSGAYKLSASDIHIEPQEKSIRLRYRIDGVLHDVVDLPIGIFRSIVSRIKMMAGMKINLRDIAQDGTFEVNLLDKKIDLRVSIIPGNFGETIVMRLLDPDSILVKLEDLGLRGLAFEALQKAIASPEGMVLTTGPTG
ncbi:MAG: GspE/PulE family protein, partial [Patescibacteria group bacterium]